MCPVADVFDMLPRLRNHARRFDEHGEPSQLRRDADDILWIDAHALRAEAIELLDAMLGVASVATHVPLTDRTARTGDWIGVTDNRYDEVAHGKLCRARRSGDMCHGFVPQHEM